jgi:hypothetical protein
MDFPPLTAELLHFAFREGVELIDFQFQGARFVAFANYEQPQTIGCDLCGPDVHEGVFCWTTLNHLSQDNNDPEEPMWKGTAEELAPKIIAAVELHCSQSEAEIEPDNGIAIGHFDTEREAALAYDRAMILLYGHQAETNFPPGESEHVTLPDEVMRQINALKAGRGRLQ